MLVQRNGYMLMSVLLAALVLAAGMLVWIIRCSPAVQHAEVAVRWPRVEPAAKWADNGRYAVIEYQDEDGTPAVAVWDSKSPGKKRTARGYVLRAVEPHAPQVWLQPVEMPEDVAAIPTLPEDASPALFAGWRLDDEYQAPDRDAEARWMSWEGPGDHAAFCEIDILKGALPSRVWLQPKDRHTEGVKAAIPEDVKTVIPVGWSPSGRFFAAEEATAAAKRRVMVFDSEDGTLVVQAHTEGVEGAPVAAWDGGDDGSAGSLMVPSVDAARGFLVRMLYVPSEAGSSWSSVESTAPRDREKWGGVEFVGRWGPLTVRVVEGDGGERVLVEREDGRRRHRVFLGPPVPDIVLEP